MTRSEASPSASCSPGSTSCPSSGRPRRAVYAIRSAEYPRLSPLWGSWWSGGPFLRPSFRIQPGPCRRTDVGTWVFAPLLFAVLSPLPPPLDGRFQLLTHRPTFPGAMTQQRAPPEVLAQQSDATVEMGRRSCGDGVKQF